MKMTYEGKSRAFRDLQLGVDAFAYENFSGRWRDLTSELKNHIVWSVLKSLVGFRGKFVESKIDDTQSIFKRVAERLKKTANLLPKPKPETSSGAEHESESETRRSDAADDRIKSQTSQAELFRTGWNDVDVDIEVPRGDGRNAPSRRFSRKKKKPRRSPPNQKHQEIPRHARHWLLHAERCRANAFFAQSHRSHRRVVHPKLVTL